MDDMTGWHRSHLYVVGHQQRHIEKAYAGETDAVILELEDAVAPSMKQAARDMVADVVSTPPPKPTYVRVNPVGSGLTFDDLAAVADKPIAGIRLAKTESAHDVRLVIGWLDELGSSLGVQALVETAAAVEQISDIATAHERVIGVSMGEQDLQADVGATGEGLAYARSRVVFAARAARLPAPWQGVFPSIRNLDELRETTVQGRRWGFFGRSAIHPDQVAVINEVFTPTDDELAEAEQLEEQLAQAVDAGSAGLRLPDGRFVDNAIVLAARRTLALGRAAGVAANQPTVPNEGTSP